MRQFTSFCVVWTKLIWIYIPTHRRGLQRLLFGVHVYVPRLWRRNVGSRLDWRFEKRRRSLRKERGNFALLSCDRTKRYLKKKNICVQHYRGSLKSLNTGIVTLLNYGKHVPPAVSHVTLAHEIGHNFGSPVILPVARYIYLYPILNYFIGVAQHDPENNRDCTPGGEDGNYIMFARATSGDKRNNNKFSPCSLKSINGVLSAKARNEQGCFTGNRQSTFYI